MTSLTRRLALKLLGAGSSAAVTAQADAASGPQPQGPPPPNRFVSQWQHCHDRVWLGAEYWANPMEDWRIVNGAAECMTGGGDRNVHLLTHQLTNPNGSFHMSVRLEQVEVIKRDGGAGFKIGIRSDINEYRSNCFSKGGIIAGVIDGELQLGKKRIKLKEGDPGTWLTLSGVSANGQTKLTLRSHAPSAAALTSLTLSVPSETLLGNVAIANNFDGNQRKKDGARYRFSEWVVSGDAFTVTPKHRFGAILWSMYTLSDSRSDEGFVLKISALTPPLGSEDNDSIELQVLRNGNWKSLGHQRLNRDAWTATFRVINWDAAQEHKYRLLYREKRKNNTVVTSEWGGTIKANPEGRPLRLGALTCQNHYGFPYEPVANNLVRLDPDMLYFSGDQLYESHGGYGLIRDPAEPAILNYLRKFYMFGMAFRDAMKDRPTVCIPDDHDVFQGNIWGEGGAPMKGLDQGASSKGGYREPARMVNVVHRTCTSHHPEAYDPTPCLQDISVYYGDLVYGNVGFAIIADRQWKSGPERVDTGSGRADHVRDKDFDTRALDKPGLVLLGERQEKFLEHWVNDWRGHTMKVLFSQTVFAGVATHHGGRNGYLKADLDSGGWPQTPRNRAVSILRPGMPLHINGDQHLTSLTQYGVEKQRDSCWSFCTPAIAAGYPRWWLPDEVGMPHQNRPAHGLPNTGEYLDGLGNKVYVYAVGNPIVPTAKNRYEVAHQKGSGFGMVTIDTDARTYKIESFRFLVDATDGNPENQFPGWPVVIHQKENRGENLLG